MPDSILEIFQSRGNLIIMGVAVSLFMVACMWKIFKKADQPGWACIVPFYNIIVILRIIQKPWYWVLLVLIPGVDVVIGILIVIELMRAFGKGLGFGLGFVFLTPIFAGILAFGDAEYQYPSDVVE